MRLTVVGGGVIGLLAAVEGVLAGHAVTVVEQGDLPNPDATSADQHRVIRALHPGDDARTAMAVRARRRWLELERMLGARLLVDVGVLTMCPPGTLAARALTAHRAGARVRVLTPAAMADAHPHLAFGVAAAGVLEIDAGVLLADRVLAACVDWLRRIPEVTLLPRRTTTAVDGATATVRLDDGDVLGADGLVVAAGPWSRRLLPPDVAAGLVLHRQTMLYLRVPDRQDAWSRTPVVASFGDPGGAWLVPPVAGTQLKISAAGACRTVTDVAGTATPPRWREHLVSAFRPIVAGLLDEWVVDARDCHYLSRADTGGGWLVPIGAHAVAHAACGGSSFKFAPLIARSSVRWATRRRNPSRGGGVVTGGRRPSDSIQPLARGPRR